MRASGVMADNAQVRPSEAAAPAAKRPRTDEDDAEEEGFAGGLNYLAELEKTQDSLNDLNEKASEEILRVEQRFNEQRKPFFEQRSRCITQLPQFWMQAVSSQDSSRSISICWSRLSAEFAV